jgi:addiction module HigA family antidote
MGISVYELAHAIRVPRSRTNNTVRGRRAVATDTAIRLGRYFSTPEFWVNLQARYDPDVAGSYRPATNRAGGHATTRLTDAAQ